MAIITVSRQMASFGDEISLKVAEKLNYTFLGRKEIEQRIVELGFPAQKLHKYDEKTPGFFASLTKDRDEYLDYLLTSILEKSVDNNVVIVGRGASFLFGDVANHISFRIVASEHDRIARLQKQQNVDEKQAKKILAAADKQKLGFHKSFFNESVENPEFYHAFINTSFFDIESASDVIAATVKATVSEKKELDGMAQIEEKLICQRIVNMLILQYGLNINFLRASARDGKVTLYGVADSSAIVERALIITQAELPEYKVESAVNVVQDFKAYQ